MLHHAARRAAGPRGVDDAGEIGAREAGRRGAGAGVGGLGGDERVPVVELDVAGLPAGQRLDADHRLAAVRPDRGREQGPRKLLGGDDDGAGAAVVEDMLVVALGVGDVGRHGDAAGRHDGEVADQPFRPVFRDQHHPVAGREAEPLQRGGEAARPCRRSRATRSSARRPPSWPRGRACRLLPWPGRRTWRRDFRNVRADAYSLPRGSCARVAGASSRPIRPL